MIRVWGPLLHILRVTSACSHWNLYKSKAFGVSPFCLYTYVLNESFILTVRLKMYVHCSTGNIPFFKYLTKFVHPTSSV